jgi:ribosomal protein S18 acetylase RimI-like enzyme
MELRTLTTDDLDAALALWGRTEHLAPVPRDEVLGLLAHDAELVLVAESNGRIVGVVLGSYDGRRGWINRLAIDDGVRRRGVGGALVAELERRLAARGCRQVNLLVFSGNGSGRSFWEASGYRGMDDVAMYSRRLGGPADDEQDPGEPGTC